MNESIYNVYFKRNLLKYKNESFFEIFNDFLYFGNYGCFDKIQRNFIGLAIFPRKFDFQVFFIFRYKIFKLCLSNVLNLKIRYIFKKFILFISIKNLITS